MVVIICAALAVFAFMLLMKVLWTKSKPALSTNLILIVSVVLVGSLGLLMASGRMHWLAAAGAAVLPFLRRGLGLLRFASLAPNLWRLFGGQSPFGQGFGQPFRSSSDAGPKVSEAETDDVRMMLDHVSGEMQGEVLTGKFVNRSLDTLSEAEIVEFYNSVADDSKRLLTAYIQRYHPNLSAGQEDTASTESTSDAMTADRARKVLGVSDTATRDEVIEAHRRLMQKNHPDRGGSEFIASEINLAKQVLLDLL